VLGRCDRGQPVVGLKTTLEERHCIGGDCGVRVEEQHVGARSDPTGRAEVDPPGEPQVPSRVDVLGAGALDHRPYVGIGGVVDDGDRVDALQRAQRRVEQVRCAVGDHDHGDRPAVPGGHRRLTVCRRRPGSRPS